MAILKPKQFIQQIFIDQLGLLVERHHYISFMVMSIGIEFLGKCLDTGSPNWNQNSSGRGDREIFESAITQLDSFVRYREYLESHKLYGSLRCGLVHSASPKNRITLSSGDEKPHLSVSNDGTLNFKCELFFEDFKTACQEVINRDFPTFDKMNQDFIQIPGTLFDENININNANISFAVTKSIHDQA